MPTITFDEYPVFTLMPTFEFDGPGISPNIVSASGSIMADAASDQSPVLGGLGGSFGEPVSVRFANALQSATLRVGHIDTASSTAVRFYDAVGTLLHEYVVDTVGFEDVSFTATLAGISSIEAVPLFSDPAGFGIDNLTFDDHFVFPQPDIEVTPDDFNPYTDETSIIDLGNAEDALGMVLRDRIGPLDFEDTFSVVFDMPTELTVSVVMDRAPNIITQVTLSFDAGRHYFEVTAPLDPEYPDDEGYRLFIGDTVDISDAAAAEAEQAGLNLGQSLFKTGSVDFAALGTAIAQADLSSSAKALKYYEGLGKGLGKFAIFLDIFFRIDDVVNSDDPGREMFIQTVDFALGMLAAWTGTQVGAGVGLTFAGIGAGVGAPVGGFTAGLVYSYAVSDVVQEEAGEFWDDQIAPLIPEGEFPSQAMMSAFNTHIEQVAIEAAIEAAAAVQAVTFDAGWYLDTYADASEAVTSGTLPSAYTHFVLYGAGLGYLPHDGGAVVDPTTLVGHDTDPALLTGLDWSSAQFQAQILSLAGDGMSAAEADLFSAISTLRRTSELHLGPERYLMALAHRKAMDLVHGAITPFHVRAMTESDNWEDTWSDGMGFREGIDRIATDLDGVVSDPWALISPYVNGEMIVTVAYSDDSSPDAVIEAFMAQAEGRYVLTNPNIQTMGIAEYSGVWVLVASLGIARPTFDRTLTDQNDLHRTGGDEADQMALGSRDGSLLGAGGHDLLTGGAGDDLLNGDAGNDTLNGNDGLDTLIGGDGDDQLTGGSSESDLRDRIYAGAGNDVLDGGYGNDELRGDAGNDTIVGGVGEDEIFGGDDADQLTGQAWSDLIFGGAGDDFINGGFGFDRVNGGSGADRFFHLGVADHGSDWIQDYAAAQGDVLNFGQAGDVSQFQVNLTETTSAGAVGVEEAFVIHRPTGQILWALVDGGAQGSINLLMGGVTYDLLA